jgi:hypothetical protein
MKVEQFHAKNQFLLTAPNCTALQSYETLIAIKLDGNWKHLETRVFLNEQAWDYSKTTGKYRNLFLGENKAETMRKIKSGEYKLLPESLLKSHMV